MPAFTAVRQAIDNGSVAERFCHQAKNVRTLRSGLKQNLPPVSITAYCRSWHKTRTVTGFFRP